MKLSWLLTYKLLRKNPEKIINGTRIGPAIVNEILVVGANEANKPPNATPQFETRIITKQQIKNLSTWLLRFVNQ